MPKGRPFHALKEKKFRISSRTNIRNDEAIFSGMIRSTCLVENAILSMIRQNIARKKEFLRFVAANKRRVDETLAPLMEEIQHLNSMWSRAKSDLEAAQSFDRQLSAAGSGKERAMLHEQCERRFGVGSPRKDRLRTTEGNPTIDATKQS